MSYRDPTAQELANPLWNSIWEVIKSWDINVPSEYSGYTGATGNHVCAIYDAVKANVIGELFGETVASSQDIFGWPHPQVPGPTRAAKESEKDEKR